VDHIVLKLAPQHVAYIRQLIGKCAFDEVAPIIVAIEQQVAAQVESFKKLESAKADAAKKVQDDIAKRAASAIEKMKPAANGSAEARA